MVTLRTFRLPALAAVVLSALLFAGCPKTPARAVDLGPAADVSFLALLNSLRVAKGLKPLAEAGDLSSVARSWSVKMASSGTLAHNPALRTEVTGARVGENVGTGGAAQQIFNALVASPGHLRNMYDPLYTRIGVGSVTDSRGVLWTTHVFQTPRTGTAAAPAPAAPAPAAPATTTAPVRRQATTPAPVRSAPAAPVTSAAPAPVAPSPVAEAALPVTEPATTPDTGPASTEVASPVAAAAASAEASTGFPLPAVLGGLALLLAIAATIAFLVRRRSGSGGRAPGAGGRAVPRWYGGQPMPQ
jgi:hypothetical protein